MSKVLMVGSIGLDSLKTPYGERDNVLGGSICYASVASSLFSPVSIVGVIGDDFPQEHIDLLNQRGINTEGLEVSEEGTFRWKGFYENDMNQAHTVETQLNAFANFNPQLPESCKSAEYVFLANIHPALQLNVLKQCGNCKFSILDTMNLWISNTKDELTEVIKNVNLVLMNEGEARQYCGTPNLVAAAKQILKLGPDYVIIKKGEHGAMLFGQNGEAFASPAFPLDEIKDPTGAGDTFAGGFIGYISRVNEINNETLRQAIIVGSTLASYTAQDFSLDRLKTVTFDDLQNRYGKYMQLTSFAELKVPQSV